MAGSHKASSVATKRRTTTSHEFADHWELADLVENQNQRRLNSKRSRAVSRARPLGNDCRPRCLNRNFQDLLKLSEQLTAESSRLSAYSYLWFFGSTKHLQARSFKQKVEEQLTALHNRLLFFDLWWQSVDDKNAERLKARSGETFVITSAIQR
ncbi:MAG: hypothetical protein U0231_13990 [Nitrospiraceae bacterium]